MIYLLNIKKNIYLTKMFEKSKFNYVSKLIDKIISFVFFLLVRCHA